MSSSDCSLLMTECDETSYELHVTDANFAEENDMTLEPEIIVQGGNNMSGDESDKDGIQRLLLHTKSNRAFNDQYVLPEGKEAHFFVSYSSEDSSRVLPIVLELEKTYGVACIIHERDFTSGMEIHENINRSMERSMKILLFLSQNFLESGYCNHEKNLAFVMSMEAGENKIIPLLLEQCIVPSSLKTLTYIDAHAEHVTDRIMEAYRNTVHAFLQMTTKQYKPSNNEYEANRHSTCLFRKRKISTAVIRDSDILPAEFNYAAMRKMENGFAISLPYETDTLCPCRPQRVKVMLDGTTRQIIQKGKFQVSEDVIQEAIDIVNAYTTTDRWSRSQPRVFCCIACCIWPFIMLALFFVWALIAISVFDRHVSQKTADIQAKYPTAFWIIFITGTISMFIGISWYFGRKGTKDLNRLRQELFNEVTLKTYKDGVIVKVIDVKQEYTIQIVRYDIKPCQRYIAQKIKALEENDGKVHNEHADSIDEYGMKADSIIRRKLKHLIDTTMPGAPEHRHYVKGGKLCFCQYLEQSLFL